MVIRNVELLLQVSEMFREIAKHLRSHGATRESKHFYSSVMAHCLMIHDYISRIETFIADDNILITSILLRLEATVTPDILKAQSVLSTTIRSGLPTTAYPRLAALHVAWNYARREGGTVDLQLVMLSIDLADDSEQPDKLIEFFEDWEDDLKVQYPDDPTLWARDDMVSLKKNRRQPSYLALNAPQSLFLALVDSKDCTCQPVHDFGVRLCLGTFQTLPEADKERDHDCAFEMFLSMQHEWHETDVCFAKSAGINFAQTNKAVQRPKVPAMKIKSLCEPIKKRKPYDRLKLRVGEDGRLWKLRSEKCYFAVDETKAPVSLQHLIQGQYRSLTDKTKRILAVILGYAVLYLHETPWLPPSWDPSSILFFHTTSSAIPLKPFIQTQLARDHAVASPETSILDPDDFDPDDLDPDDIMIHQCPHLVTLGIVLMELYLATSFKELAEKYGVSLNDRTRPIDAELVFEQCKNEIPENSQFHYAVKKCLDPKVWEDNNGARLSDNALKAAIYQEVVSPLEDELSQAFSYISLEQLDRIAQTLDLATRCLNYRNWRRRFKDVYEKYILQPPNIPVKIAVFDTGVDQTHPDVDACIEQIKGQFNWTNEKFPRLVDDYNGHGTFITSLLMEYCPDAEIYIAKISDGKPCSPSIIAKALDYAVNEWQVDIISMSFGFHSRDVEGYDELERAIHNAYSSRVLLFAAASNSGANLDRAYPARDENVICINSTDANGNRSPFSPTALADTLNLATVGEAVESAWPMRLCELPSGLKHRSGTSYATPIAVSIAGFLLQYARLHIPEQAYLFQRQSKMKAVLRKIAEKSLDSRARDDYHFVALSLYSDNLFGKDPDFINHTLRDILRR
ncbi:putative subtilisin [Aspergillus uvarum CBS 121591]|uniref:Putative subtilisin n=1 Tax=Aspergillus uvarum CBS 121591 TaxID=1448315 RepID=A0A319CL34_9EURO|nr:putative subtilisin [Aspergillus uvarum CBS 121591]PYH85260.1 putative subtilisin [Aspergillus uvarum CBS 121591]